MARLNYNSRANRHITSDFSSYYFRKSVPKHLNFGAEISFGKYKGKTIAQIFEQDPKYLLYLKINNPSLFSVDVRKEILNKFPRKTELIPKIRIPIEKKPKEQKTVYLFNTEGILLRQSNMAELTKEFSCDKSSIYSTIRHKSRFRTKYYLSYSEYFNIQYCY